MSKILITGNGFDLFHHLPTKYHHFISVMETIEGNQITIDASFDDLFSGLFKSKHEFEYKAIVENYNTTNIKISHEKINKIKQLLENNLWYKHFKNVTEIDTWIDFEIEVESVLNQLKIFSKYQDSGKIEKNEFQDTLIKYTNFDMFNIVKLFGNVGYFRLDLKYINKRKGAIDLKTIIEDLLKEFEDFIIIFNRYLVDVINVFYPELKQKSSIPFHLLDEVYTFNYTPTLENIYKVDKVIYLHGRINEDCKKQNLVLGVSEINDNVKMNKGYGFTKYYQKIRKNTNYDFIEIPNENSGYDEETFFYIIGHSLDKSDKEYVLDLFRFLEQDRLNKSKINVFYYNEKDKSDKIRNLLSIVKEEVVSRMHRKKRLCFIELNNENIEKEFKEVLYKHQYTF